MKILATRLIFELKPGRFRRFHSLLSGRRPHQRASFLERADWRFHATHQRRGGDWQSGFYAAANARSGLKHQCLFLTQHRAARRARRSWQFGSTSMGVFDAEFRYRIPNTWIELRGEGVWVTFSNPANLRANNDSDPTDNVGKNMYGFSGEVAMHMPMGTIIGTQWEAVPFYRYTNQNFQTGVSRAPMPIYRRDKDKRSFTMSA